MAKNMYKGLTATAITLALAGTAFSTSAFADEIALTPAENGYTYTQTDGYDNEVTVTLTPQDTSAPAEDADTSSSESSEESLEDSSDPSADSSDTSDESSDPSSEVVDSTEDRARPAQSDAVETLVGSEDASNPNFDLLFDAEKGLFTITFNITDDAEGDQVIDLTEALRALNIYVGGGYDMEAGDSVLYEVYITSDSQHTYRYQDGSFILSTPELNGASEDAAIEGFDGQLLLDEYFNHEKLSIGYRATGPNRVTNEKLDKVDGDVESLLGGAAEALVYRAQMEDYIDQSEYNQVLYTSGEMAPSWIKILNLTPQQKYALSAMMTVYGIMTPNQTAVENYLDAHYDGSYENYLVEYYREKDGVEYQDFDQLLQDSTCINDLYGTGDLQLTQLERPTTASFYNNFYQNLFSFIYGSEQIEEVAGAFSPIEIPKMMTVEELESTAGKGFVDWACNWEGCSEESVLYYYKKGETIGTVAELADAYDAKAQQWYYEDENGNKVYLEPVYEVVPGRMQSENDSWDNEQGDLAVGDYMQALEQYVTGMKELSEKPAEELTEEEAAALEAFNNTAWAKANAYFTQLLADGLTAEDASAVSFRMAFNLDGEETGNDYMLTTWSYYNSLMLRQADGDLLITKTDEDGNPLENAGYELWQITTSTKEDGSTEDVYEYFYGSKVEGEDYYTGIFMTKIDGERQGLNCTLYTDANGTIYIKFLDEEGDYRLQETEAPEGYELDDTVYDIVIQGGYTTRIDLVNYLLPSISEDPTPEIPTPPTIVDIPDETPTATPAPEENISDDETPLELTPDEPISDELIDEIIAEIDEEIAPLEQSVDEAVSLNSVPKTGARSTLPVTVLSAALAALLLKKRRRAK